MKKKLFYLPSKTKTLYHPKAFGFGGGFFTFKMKDIIFTLVVILSIGLTTQAQLVQEATDLGYTVVTENIYNTIKFEGILFTDIKATNGDIDQMANLFPVEDNGNTRPTTGLQLAQPNTVTIEEPGAITGDVYRDFKYHNGLEVTFFGENQGDDLEVIDLKSDNITINGVTLQIGDPITDLTSINYIIKTGTINNQFINIVKEGEYAVSLSLDLDSNNNIVKIHYFEIP
ncbi:hypothetical protein [Psychroflexus montanilacus]|uniref:hypothetical protein n=1 Tax=Psychroflexus montanilacus TaxID=2873598 RepID=UPI001CCFE1DA|nr:hypothetical protein [Psychroflexus montanilacus]MBZ9652206.1 hypothetical protein [Psychroflexus montanilacus]